MSEENGAGRPGYYLVRGKRYDIPQEMTGRELRLIKAETGVRAGEIAEELQAGDADLLLTLVVVAMRRAGETVGVDDLLDLKLGAEGEIEVYEDVEEDDGPPTEPADAPVGEPATKAPTARTGRRRSGASSASGRGK